MSTQETSNASRLAALVVSTWVEPASEYVYDVYGIRKACGNASDMLLALEDYSEERSKKLDELHEVWNAARSLDKEIESANQVARELRLRILKALQA
jgi:hypothetical protein